MFLLLFLLTYCLLNSSQFAVAVKLSDLSIQQELDEEFLESVRQGKTDRVHYLIQQGANVNAIRKNDPFGRTALLYSAQYPSNSAILRLLVEAGANISARTQHGATALLFASAANQVDAVKILLEAGANPNERRNDSRGYTALLYSNMQYSDHPDKYEVVKLLIKFGADVNIRSHQGTSALILAARNDDVDMAMVLIDAGADKSFVDQLGQSVLSVGQELTREFIRNYEPDFRIKR